MPLPRSRDPGKLAPLLERYARERHPADLERLVVAYQPLARGLARRYASPQAKEDFEQAACEGLVKALQRFDPSRGCTFTSFAIPTIVGELRRYRRDTAWTAHVPRRVQERVLSIRATAHDLTATDDRPATPTAIACRLGWSEEDVVEALTAASSLTSVPLDGITHDDDGTTLADRLGREEPGYEEIDCRTTIDAAFPALSVDEKVVIRLRFAEDLNLGEIACRLGISRSKAGRVLGRGLERLRAEARA